jgi:outer membrane protein assembly factor BamB
MNIRTTLFAAVVCVMLACLAHAADSPQFRGLNRTGVFEEQGLLSSWPETGPPVAWTAKGLGKGYSSVSVAGGKVYTTGMRDDQTGAVLVFNELTGALEQTLPYGKESVEEQAPGSRATPTIENGRLYLMSGLGVLYCIDLSSGGKLWEADLFARFSAKNIMWQLAESVLVDGDKVICTPGGTGGLVAALNKNTGETVWAATLEGDRASYCTPIIANHNGRRILLTGTAKNIIGVDPDSGKLLWSFAHKVPWDIHGVTPVYGNGLVYYTSGDGVGGGALELSPDGSSVTSKWLDTTLDCLHHGVVLVDGYLYGTGYKAGGKLVCLEMPTGKVMWTSKEVKEGMVVAADGMLYVYEGPKAGTVNLVKASPGGFERSGRFQVTEGTDQHWAHPTIANGRLYIRHGDALAVYTISKP